MQWPVADFFAGCPGPRGDAKAMANAKLIGWADRDTTQAILAKGVYSGLNPFQSGIIKRAKRIPNYLQVIATRAAVAAGRCSVRTAFPHLNGTASRPD